MKKSIISYVIILSLTLVVINVCAAQTEIKIPDDSLPALIHSELHKKYARYVTNSVLKKTDNLRNITYRIEIQKKSTVIELLYDKEGKLISKIKSKVYSYDGTEKSRTPSSEPHQSNDGHNH